MFFIGVVVCGVAYIMGGTDLGRLDFETSYEEKEYVALSSSISNIVIDVDRHDVVFTESPTVSEIAVGYYENQYDIFSITEDEGTITITNKFIQNAFIRFFCLLFDGDNTDNRVLSIVVPTGFYGKMDIACSKADVSFDGVHNLDELKLNVSDGDVALNTITCKTAALNVAAGELSITGGVYETLDIVNSNPAEYLPIDEIDPELYPMLGITPPPVTPQLTPTPGGIVVVTPTPEVTPSVDPSATPDGTPSASPDVTPSATPEVTPEITATPRPTKAPTYLVVSVAMVLEGVDVKDLKINAIYTNIEGTLARGESYYKITTDNVTNSNIETNNNKTAVGTITITQKDGSTELDFK